MQKRKAHKYDVTAEKKSGFDRSKPMVRSSASLFYHANHFLAFFLSDASSHPFLIVESWYFLIRIQCSIALVHSIATSDSCLMMCPVKKNTR